MMLEDIQTAIEYLTVGRKAKDRKTFLIVHRDGQTVIVRRVGVGWDLIVQLPTGSLYTSSGRIVRADVSWRDAAFIEISVGDMSGAEFRPRGSWICLADDVVSIEEAVQ